MLLSIVINAWPGTDLFRFRLQLETLTHDTADVNNYLNLCKDVLNGWDKNKFTIPDDKFASIMTKYNFNRTEFDTDNVEVLLAIDAKDKSAIEDEFEDWCSTYSINHKVIRAKLGAAGMRNAALQIYDGDFVIFRDDDDFSASIGKLLNQCKALDFMGGNSLGYQKQLSRYDIITERWKYFQYNQKKPTIAIMMDGMKLKNTWGSLDNPFSATPTPVDTSTVELVDRAPFTSMCSKIFTREATRLIYNSTCCGSLEDARSHYLQQLPQHCIWLFTEKQLSWLRKEWEMFMRDRSKGNAGVRWLNMNVISYQEWQIPLRNIKHHNEVEAVQYTANKTKVDENIKRVDSFFKHNFYVSKCAPNFIYVLASGSYSRVSWTYGSVVGALEAFRNSNRMLDFTIADLKQLKKLITSAIKTTLVDTNNVSKLEWLSDQCKKEGTELIKLLTPIVNYRYIFWFGIVHGDWKMFEDKIKQIRELIWHIHVKAVDGADTVKDDIKHPNTSVKVTVDGVEKRVSLCNGNKMNCNDSMRYTDQNEIDTRIIGGSNESMLPMILLIAVILIVVIYFACKQYVKARGQESTYYKQCSIRL